MENLLGFSLIVLDLLDSEAKLRLRKLEVWKLKRETQKINLYWGCQILDRSNRMFLYNNKDFIIKNYC